MMTPFVAPDLAPAFPEIVLAILTSIILMLGVFSSREGYKNILTLSVMALLAAALLVFQCSTETITTFGGMFIIDGFSGMMKMLVVLGAAASIFLSRHYIERERMGRFEYPVLILFATIGMMLMISANDLMALYIGLEMQSLPLYVLASMQRDTIRSPEAGLKYFVLGALSSGLLLYGSSLLYGYTGTTQFDGIAEALAGGAGIGAIVGMVLVLSGLAFKISAVPFHMWTPDVYEGAPTSVTAFFAIVPKIAALALLSRVLMGPFGGMVEEWRQIIILLSIASMALGGIAAIAQTNIKRMLAYSSIGHMGYALAGLAAASEAGLKAVIIYAALYMLMGIGTFAIVLMMKKKDRMVEKIQDLAGLAKKQPLLALAMAIMMFSMAGIPPLAGFFGKLFIFQAAVAANLFTLAIIGVLTSVIAAYYYLRIIKIMYFDEGVEEGLDMAEDRGLNFALTLSTLAVVLFILMPAPLLSSAGAAAESLLR